MEAIEKGRVLQLKRKHKEPKDEKNEEIHQSISSINLEHYGFISVRYVWIQCNKLSIIADLT